WCAWARALVRSVTASAGDWSVTVPTMPRSWAPERVVSIETSQLTVKMTEACTGKLLLVPPCDELRTIARTFRPTSLGGVGLSASEVTLTLATHMGSGSWKQFWVRPEQRGGRAWWRPPGTKAVIRS